MEEPKNPWANAEWRVRTAMSVLEIEKDEAEKLEACGLLEHDITVADVFKKLGDTPILPATLENLLRGVLRIPPPPPPGRAAHGEGPPLPLKEYGEPPAVPGVGIPEMGTPSDVPGIPLKEFPDVDAAHWLKKLQKPVYVVHPSGGLPVVRALRTPIYDTIIVPEHGRICEDAFSDSKWFSDHTKKVPGRDTNLCQNGHLGYPLEYDLHYLEVVFEKYAHPEDVRRVLRSMALTWFFGQDNKWVTTRLSLFQPSFSYESLAGLGADLPQVVATMLEGFAKDGVWPVYRHDMCDKEGRPRRIFSTESFRCRIEGDAGELYAPVRLKVKMQDTLYGPI